jgi:hypothetical protein
MIGTLWMYSRYTKFVNCVHHQVLALQYNVKKRASFLFLSWKIGDESTEIGPINGAPYSQPLFLWLKIPNLWLSYIQLFLVKQFRAVQFIYGVIKWKIVVLLLMHVGAALVPITAKTGSGLCTNEKIHNCSFCPMLFAVFRFHVNSVSSAYINFSYMFWSYNYRHGDQISTPRCPKVYTYVYSLWWQYNQTLDCE